MSDGPIIVTSPTLSYVTRETTALCEATKDLLLWMRAQGFGCTHLEVTAKGVLIGGADLTRAAIADKTIG